MFNKLQSRTTDEKLITITNLAFFINVEIFPDLTILILGFMIFTFSVGSNSSGDGCIFMINFLFSLVRMLQII